METNQELIEKLIKMGDASFIDADELFSDGVLDPEVEAWGVARKLLRNIGVMLDKLEKKLSET